MLVGWEEIYYTIPSTSDPCSICVPNHECADHLQPVFFLGHAPTSRSTHVGCQLSIAGELLSNRWEWCVGDVISWCCSFYFAVASSLPTDAIRSRNLTFKTTERRERPFASKAFGQTDMTILVVSVRGNPHALEISSRLLEPQPQKLAANSIIASHDYKHACKYEDPYHDCESTFLHGSIISLPWRC
jgi:hypothetical protein